MDELRAKDFKNVVVKTNKGKSIEADLAIPCTGLKVNYDAYKTSLGMSLCAFTSGFNSNFFPPSSI